MRDRECQAETDGFTPIQLSRIGRVTICGYSSCWEGRIGFSRNR